MFPNVCWSSMILIGFHDACHIIGITENRFNPLWSGAVDWAFYAMQENIDGLIGNRRPNPFENASIFRKLSYRWVWDNIYLVPFWQSIGYIGLWVLSLFRWLHDLLKLGLKRPIECGDIYQTLESHRSKVLTDTFSARWNRDCMKKKKPKLTRILQHIYAKRVIGVSILYTILNTSIR